MSKATIHLEQILADGPDRGKPDGKLEANTVGRDAERSGREFLSLADESSSRRINPTVMSKATIHLEQITSGSVVAPDRGKPDGKPSRHNLVTNDGLRIRAAME